MNVFFFWEETSSSPLIQWCHVPKSLSAMVVLQYATKQNNQHRSLGYDTNQCRQGEG
jgi:hypothetical protein